MDAVKAELGLLAGWFEERKRGPGPGIAERGNWKRGVWGGLVWRLMSLVLIRRLVLAVALLWVRALSTSVVPLGTRAVDAIFHGRRRIALSCYKVSVHPTRCRDTSTGPVDNHGHPCRSAGPSQVNMKFSRVSVANIDKINLVTPRGPSLRLSAGPSRSGRWESVSTDHGVVGSSVLLTLTRVVLCAHH